MNIVHIAPNASFTEGWSYQENLLPKYQARLGHNVTLIVRNSSRPNKELITVPCTDSFCKEGFRVIRREVKETSRYNLLFSPMKVYDLLVELKPDLVFFHGMISSTIFEVVRYKKKNNPHTIIVMDNHLDSNIGRKPGNSIKSDCLLSIYKLMYRVNDRYINKVYGVTPWRRQYAVDVFGVPAQKSDVLIMGADDDLIDFPHKEQIRESVRSQFGIADTDLLIVTGGKIDSKKKIHLLMSACKNLDVKLIVFGNVSDDIKTEFDDILEQSSNIKFVGWKEGKDIYDIFLAADLCMFPGQHSVLWEQACATKVPCVFGRWPGMEHVDVGGNSDFIDEVTIDSIQEKINELHYTDQYSKMKSIAESSKTDVFLYSNIAKKSIETLSNP